MKPREMSKVCGAYKEDLSPPQKINLLCTRRSVLSSAPLFFVFYFWFK
jgi:hypothetical protein